MKMKIPTYKTNNNKYCISHETYLAQPRVLTTIVIYIWFFEVNPLWLYYYIGHRPTIIIYLPMKYVYHFYVS